MSATLPVMPVLIWGQDLSPGDQRDVDTGRGAAENERGNREQPVLGQRGCRGPANQSHDRGRPGAWHRRRPIDLGNPCTCRAAAPQALAVGRLPVTPGWFSPVPDSALRWC